MQGSKRLWQFLFLGAGMAFGNPAAAHSDEHLATVPAPHGGVLRMAGALHLELVLEPGLIRVYLTDHAFQPVNAAGATANAMLREAGNRVRIPLKPAGGNLLQGKGRFRASLGTAVTVEVRLPGKGAETAEFPSPHPNPAADTQSQGHANH